MWPSRSQPCCRVFVPIAAPAQTMPAIFGSALLWSLAFEPVRAPLLAGAHPAPTRRRSRLNVNYGILKAIHVGAVALSFCGYFARALGALAEAP